MAKSKTSPTAAAPLSAEEQRIVELVQAQLADLDVAAILAAEGVDLKKLAAMPDQLKDIKDEVKEAQRPKTKSEQLLGKIYTDLTTRNAETARVMRALEVQIAHEAAEPTLHLKQLQLQRVILAKALQTDLADPETVSKLERKDLNELWEQLEAAKGGKLAKKLLQPDKDVKPPPNIGGYVEATRWTPEDGLVIGSVGLGAGAITAIVAGLLGAPATAALGAGALALIGGALISAAIVAAQKHQAGVEAETAKQALLLKKQEMPDNMTAMIAMLSQ